MQNLDNENGVNESAANSNSNFLDDDDALNSKPKSALNTILLIAVTAFVLMFCYELLKQFLFPAISVWESHLSIVVFSTLIAVIAAFAALRSYKNLYEKTLVETKRLKRMQSALISSENRFSELFDNANDIIYTIDLAGNFTSLNKAGELLTGYSRVEALKMNVAQIVAENYLKLAREMIQNKINGMGATVYELQIIAKDGHKFFVEVSTCLIERSGKPVGIQGIARTNGKQAEEALRESEMRFRAVTETALDAIIIIDNQSQIVFANEACEKIFGYKISELIGQNITILMPEYLQQLHLNGIQSYRETGIKKLSWSSVEVIGLRKDKSEFPFEISFSEFVNKGERFFTGVIRDITMRKKAEQALRESEEQFRSFYENAPLGIYRSTPDGQVLMANPAVLQMIDFTLEEIQKRNLNEESIESKPQRNWFRETIERDGEIKGLETVWVKRDKTTVFVRENARCVRDAQNNILYYEGTVEDITERKKLEEQLRQSQKMEAVGQLAGGVAHDFNNILTVINGYGDLTLRRLPADDRMRRNIEEIVKAGNRAAALTKQLLAFSRKQILEPKILNLNLVVEDMEKMLRRLIGEDIDFVTSLDNNLGNVEADPGQIEQVILNLVVNARDAMPLGGKLIIETSRAQFSSASERNGNFVMLAVSDSGLGMDAETREHIFEPFFTTKESGTGLGLSTVYGIVKQSNGHINIYSEKGRGTSIKIYLPLVVDKTLDLTVLAGEGVAFLGGTETVLLVEDEIAVRELVKDILQTNGFKVLAAENSEDALNICEKYKDVINLTLTDVVMPQISGRELADRLVKMHPEMKVLYMSGYTNSAIVHHGVLEEGTHFVQKPFAPRSLVLKVRETLDAKV